jgi:hypothetical protein
MSNKKRDLTKELADEIDVFDTMFASLIELLEEKGILTQDELEKRIREKTARAGGLTKYRNIQFDDKIDC